MNITSANTSINKNRLPAVFGMLEKSSKIKEGHYNIDFGGGKYDNVNEHLYDHYHAYNFVFDPYNRTAHHNATVKNRYMAQADSATCSNVLNVILHDIDIHALLQTMACYLPARIPVYFTVYEGDKTGTGRITKADCYQRNQRLEEYLPYLTRYFEVVEVTRKLITCYTY